MSYPNNWLRISFLTGAIADGIVAVIMLGQTIFALPSPITNSAPEIAYRYAMGLAGIMMLGWSLLLFWAARDPVYRRGVLPVTIIVIFGLIANNIFAYAYNLMSLDTCITLVLFQMALIVLFATSYINSKLNSSGSCNKYNN